MEGNGRPARKSDNLTAVKKNPGEFLVECRGSKVIEQEMARGLHSDLNASSCAEIRC
jgi:hypothetical protein